MKPHYDDGETAVYLGDCIEVMRTLPDASVDAVVTDPPYGLGFMGKHWDALPPGLDFAEEAYRVLKPGGHILAFGGSRTWHRLAVAIEDAGFELRDSIAWLYGSGFPKSMDVSKAIDKAAGAERASTGKFTNRHASRAINKIMEEFVSRDYDPTSGRQFETAPATDAARKWEGWGTALKPAFEPIVVGRKPLNVGGASATVAANVLTHGVGALNIDATRVHSHDSEAKAYTVQRMAPGATQNATGKTHTEGVEFSGETKAGRWPTNVILDDSQAAALDAEVGTLTSGANPKRRGADGDRTAYGDFAGQADANPVRGVDKGGPSRFFPTFKYQAKAPKSERPLVDGVAHATVKPIELMRWLIRLVVPKGATILEPFAGSGTTVEAAILEGVHVIAIEREEEYWPLIRHRIARGNGVLDTPTSPSLG